MYLSQLTTFIIFFFTGIIIGILFDIFRILRKSFKTFDLMTYIEDFIFWILAGIIILYSIFTFNNGELRAYLFTAIIFGFIMYLLVFSKYFILINTKIIHIIKKIIYYPFSIILKILKKYIFYPIKRAFNGIYLKSNEICKKIDKNRRIFWKNVEKYK